MKTPSLNMSAALKFVILIGTVSLFADMTYEGARSISGQYLALLGATGAVIGFVSGFGELIGYAFRFVSGYLTDKTGRYWLITYVGYAINLLAVPLLALADNWPAAAALLIAERFGKSIRTPPRDAMLSYATHEMGRGWGFGLHGAMDRLGAILGPLIISVILYYQGTYQMSFAMLLIPALCALSVLAVSMKTFPRPQDLEIETPDLQSRGMNRTYWIYITAVCCVAAGYVDFPLIAYHFEKLHVVPKAWIPIFFAVAMATDGLSGLLIGKIYDKKGLSVLLYTTALSSLFAPLVFLSGFYGGLLGMILWGIGLGTQESIMRAIVAHLVSRDKRGRAYGIMNMWFGVSWFLGSALMGILYDFSLPTLILFSLVLQLAAVPIFWLVKDAKNS